MSCPTPTPLSGPVPTSQVLDPLAFPLHGSKLIEASAGTGKTWTIAALYVRLILGHGTPDTAYARPLLPSEILVMTFTRAATRELSDRIRARLLEAAACFREREGSGSGRHVGERGEDDEHDESNALFDGDGDDYGSVNTIGDPFLRALRAAVPPGPPRAQAARRLALAAEMMDEAAVFTIDAWCQRVLREHAFESGALFDEELSANLKPLLRDAVRDYWRQQLYPLDGETLASVLNEFGHLDKLSAAVEAFLRIPAGHGTAPVPDLPRALAQWSAELSAQRAALKHGWAQRARELGDWLADQLAPKTTPFNRVKLKPTSCAGWCQDIIAWAEDPAAELLDLKSGWKRLTATGLQDACKEGLQAPHHPALDDLAQLHAAQAALPTLRGALIRHATGWVRARLAVLKRHAQTFGFDDMLERLDRALHGPNAERLRERIVTQYPVALIDEFQDTSPIQYRIFDRLYRTADNDAATGLFLIGDPKQSIYGFRGADIHSYLNARRSTAGRHFALGTNYRSTHALIGALNQVFAHAEGDVERPGYAAGTFRFRQGPDNPVPFEPVQAQGRPERLLVGGADAPALTLWHRAAKHNNDAYRRTFSAHCAEQIVHLLNDGATGFAHPDGSFARLRPGDIAVLVRTGKEAEAVRRALHERGVASVYLSEKDSVFASQEAEDIGRWLAAVASPLDARKTRAAWAARTVGLSLPELAHLAADDLAWDEKIEHLKALGLTWRRQGVLAMLRQTLHDLDLPARLLKTPGGERALTNFLHLGELLQAASQTVEGELALTRWLAEQISAAAESDEAQLVRLESDTDLVKVVTLHKSKGLEYPLVMMPFCCSFRRVDKRGSVFFQYVDARGQSQVDFARTEAAMSQADAARLQEDIRLLYVGMTRARHALWLGVATLYAGKQPALHASALGYFLADGALIEEAALLGRLVALKGGCPGIALTGVDDTIGRTLLAPREDVTALAESPPYDGVFDKSWSVASFSSLARDLPPYAAASALTVQSARDENLLEDLQESALDNHRGTAPWHQFPRGPVPGNFLHEQLEWLACEGFELAATPDFERLLGNRCDRLGWGHRKDDTIAWLHTVATTALPPIEASLTQVTTHIAEMEFWFPNDHCATRALDAACARHILPGQPRPALPEKQLHGMLRGFMDLVFEWEGRYWVLDYKSNALGQRDADYHGRAMAGAVLAHRYDVQAALYALALHRLLAQRLGEAYDPEMHLGGAVFFFLRGIAGPERGCLTVPAPPALLDELEHCMARDEAAA